MKPFAALAGSARRGARALALVSAALYGSALLAAPALAGDSALLEIHGYSEDGRYFAFEEYGIQDGSGFPYTNLFVVDLSADRWVSGTPVRARDDSEIDTQTMADLQRIREEARQAAGPVLAELDITTPARIVALLGDGSLEDGETLEFGIPGFTGPGSVGETYRLALETFEAGSPHDCETFLGTPALGYALSITGEDGARELHRDGANLPASRGCATAYRLYGVVIPYQTYGLEAAVALVSVYPFGFEGPDRRFLAVPLGR
ncbi:DUF2259 domain-containing protein [Arsenicitalea aurantiaca]|uniref:DUF2259 domain-containing protein n=1 Tax=Arsenicitalea aurantiaca TaxID=1783274 RepID=A0A433X854_9HYPH|nr:DUF2259 domain-containing protein [Arsenicitalea aurantiaca]RUT30245.1 DUF2259 domain-containing protein [Arsenicitalea aurantiaca]